MQVTTRVLSFFCLHFFYCRQLAALLQVLVFILIHYYVFYVFRVIVIFKLLTLRNIFHITVNLDLL